MIKLSIAILGLVLLAGCTLVPSSREGAHLERAIRGVTGVSDAHVYGQTGLAAVGQLYADLVVDGTHITLAGLGYDSLSPGSGPAVLYRIDALEPVSLSCLSGPHWAGEPRLNPRRRMARTDFSRTGLFGAHLAPPASNVIELIGRHSELRVAVARWPLCPDFWEFKDAAGTQYRYCNRGLSSDPLPPWPDGCDAA